MIDKIHPHQLSVFKTIPTKNHPLFLDVQSEKGISDPSTIALLESLPSRGIAVVGTRYPQRRSIEIMARAFEEIKEQNLVVISGFARGIDSRAHELALDYGLKTIAFLGCGIEFDYPRENRHLKRRILESGGLIISEFEKNSPAYAGNFLQRNRLIAGFANATWVVEGAAISGTLNTAMWTMQFNRDLYATSCFPGDSFYQGNEKLLSEFETDRFPIAKPFFSAKSLSFTWKEFNSAPELKLNSLPRTQIQKWVEELRTAHGACQIQTLMNYAYKQGLTPGKFYLQFEKEIELGSLAHHPDGSVTYKCTSPCSDL